MINKSTEVVQNEDLTFKKKRKRLFIILGIVVIILIALKINKSRGFNDPFDDVDILGDTGGVINNEKLRDMNTLSKKLEEDYKSGKLSSDEYIMQSAYSIFDKDKLDSEYKNLDIDSYNPSKLFENASGMLDKLSDETLLYIYNKLTLSDVEWNVVEDKAEIKDMSFDSSYDIELMGNDNKISKLDEVKLSDNGNFLIYYTKKGHNAITDTDAGRIASILEQSVDTYRSEFGFDYSYSAHFEVFSVALSECPLGSAKGRACSLLRDHDIDISYLNTAMPVYVIDTGDDNVLGYYLPYINDFQQLIVKISTLLKDYGEAMNQAAATYSFPYFVVNSNISNYDNTNIVAAHELFHHYQHYICGNGGYADCPTGNFPIETTANLASINVNNINNINTAINGHAAFYSSEADKSVDQAGDGYGTFVFASNYMDIVPNGKNYIFNSVKENNPLNYLYDNSSDKYKEVLVTTAEKNITHDYDNKLLIAARDGNFYYPSGQDTIGYTDFSKTKPMNYSSMHYYYINPRGYHRGNQLSFSGNSRDLTLLVFIYEGHTYKKIYSQTLSGDTSEFVINIDDFNHYGQVAFGLVNSKVNETLRYTYELDTNGTKTPTVTAESLGLDSDDRDINDFNSFICSSVEDNSSYNVITQIKLSFDKKGKINDMYYKGTIRLKEFAPDDPAYKIAKNLVSGAFKLMQIAYKEQFKYFKVITEEQDDKYMITFKITKNYYDALNNSLKIKGQTKYDIISEIEVEGFICHYSK